MKSFEALGMRKIHRMNKKGQALDLTSSFIVGLLIFIVTVFAILFGIAQLNPGSFFAAGSANQNATNQLTSNTTTGIANFSQQIPTVFTVLGVVLILGVVGLLLLIVRRFAGGGGTGVSI